MRIAILSQHFDLVLPPSQNSVGIWTFEVARRLGKHSEVTVLMRRPRRASRHRAIDEAKVELLRCAPARLWSVASKAWEVFWPGAPLFAQPFYALDFLVQALRAIRRIRPDVIHIQNFPQYVPLVRLFAPDAAIMLHMHCDWLAQLNYQQMKRAIDASDLIVGCSAHVVSAAQKRFPTARARFAVLPNGTPVEIDTDRSLRADTDRVLFVGRISPEKGIHTLLEAWPSIVAARPGAQLEIVGPTAEVPRQFLIDLSGDPDVRALARFCRGGDAYAGTYLNALQALVPPHLRDTVTFQGEFSYDMTRQRYFEASILANPSLSESFGMSLVEALSSGTPVVATRVGGMPEIVEATGGGLLVEKNDPAALGNAIIQMLAARDEAETMGRRGQARVRDLYGWDRVAELTNAYHVKALAARHSRDVPSGFTASERS